MYMIGPFSEQACAYLPLGKEPSSLIAFITLHSQVTTELHNRL